MIRTPTDRAGLLSWIPFFMERYSVTRLELETALEWEEGTLINQDTNAAVAYSTLTDNQLLALQWKLVEIIKDKTGISYPRF